MTQVLFWAVFLVLYSKGWRIFLRSSDQAKSLFRLGNLPEHIHGPYRRPWTRRRRKEKRLRA